ncbi:MAG: polyphosphate polymerase domain-containing protein [Bacteroidales bacterium]|nr:polyphosphate polymerase domain-containing protein [Bacteroidales bacterium]
MISESLPAIMRMEPITLEEMDSIKLMNRVDTKFLTTEETLEKALAMAAGEGYRILVTDGLRISPYDTLYYDTPELRMYTEHRRKKLTRKKVRVRTYVASGITFLEVKRKNNKGRTKKKRMEVPSGEMTDFRSDAAACAFLLEKSGYAAGDIAPRLYTRFHRITLVNPEKTERLTVDMSLEFENFSSGMKVSLGPAVIIELKQDGLADSRIRHILNELRVKPARVSKYCIGTALAEPSARPGRFAEKIRYIEKLTGTKILN